ncbi:MAG TPA: GNAT family N-acetyltransferase [Candidatus Acidoferrales bacterium]|jgi:GNAT superfamily N-acetyltransferase|nr:GNAT family N-acetyltransferase [Candidatus Acidoferrales bacterium]
MNVAARQFAGEIRLARPQDYPRMAELAGQLGYPSTSDDIARRLTGFISTGEQVVFVAQLADGTIAGWIGAFVYRCVEADARVEISGLVVDERFRSQSVGRLLLDRAEAWAREKRFTATSLRSNVIRERAHAFYERQGYEHTKTQKSFRKKL